MERRLNRLPGPLGPAVTWGMRSRAYRVYEHLDQRKWARLTAAITFNSFVALFPVLGLGAAIGAALLSEATLNDVERWITDQIPGISGRLDLHDFFDNARTIGLLSLAAVIPTGASWVGTLRECLRAVWDLPDLPENVLRRQVRDVGLLAGLGCVVLLSLGTSLLGQGAMQWAGQRLGGGAEVPVRVAAYLLAVVITFLLLLYLLVWLPGVRPPRRAVLTACAVGTAGFELLKLLLGSYLSHVAGQNLYGAFGLPIALLIWMSMMARLLLVCCAWTATSVTPSERPEADALDATEALEAELGPRPDDPAGLGYPRSGPSRPAAAADDGGGTPIRRPSAG